MSAHGQKDMCTCTGCLRTPSCRRSSGELRRQFLTGGYPGLYRVSRTHVVAAPGFDTDENDSRHLFLLFYFRISSVCFTSGPSCITYATSSSLNHLLRCATLGFIRYTCLTVFIVLNNNSTSLERAHRLNRLRKFSYRTR